MSWYYVDQGNQSGPYEPEVFQGLIADGTIRPETLVYGPGMSDWISLADARGQGLLPQMQQAAPPASVSDDRPNVGLTDAIACPNCGARVSSSDLIPLEGRQVCPHCRDLALQQIREGVGLDTNNLDYAGFGMRFLGTFIDGIIMQIYGVLLQLVFGLGYTENAFEIMGGLGLAFYLILSYAVPIAYAVYFMGHDKYRATPGMMAVKIKIIRPDGSRVTRWRIFGRYLGSIISSMILLIGYLMMLWDDENRTLHDRMADTRVVYW